MMYNFSNRFALPGRTHAACRFLFTLLYAITLGQSMSVCADDNDDTAGTVRTYVLHTRVFSANTETFEYSIEGTTVPLTLNGVSTTYMKL